MLFEIFDKKDIQKNLRRKKLRWKYELLNQKNLNIFLESLSSGQIISSGRYYLRRLTKDLSSLDLTQISYLLAYIYLLFFYVIFIIIYYQCFFLWFFYVCYVFYLFYLASNCKKIIFTKLLSKENIFQSQISTSEKLKNV